MSELAALVLNEKGDSAPQSDENKVEMILEEFATTIDEHVGSDTVGDVDRMLEGWVAMEDTEFV